eukprot:GAFH01002169.1.p4 GENE.GAFH01002169.1~~GAFH01002169.1.p4  ORF type:complete len:170 (-),score=56.84 GAFH01002169.1:30-539(-)
MKQRVEQQAARNEAIQTRLKEYEEELAKLQQHHELSIKQRLEEHRNEHTKLGQMLISVMKKLEVLHGAGRRGLSSDECSLRNKLEAIQAELNRPTKFKATLNELEPLLERMHRSAPAEANSLAVGLNDDTTAHMHKILQEQSVGIEQLAQIAREDARDADILKEQLQQQ